MTTARESFSAQALFEAQEAAIECDCPTHIPDGHDGDRVLENGFLCHDTPS